MFRFLISQKLQQPFVLNFISRRIKFRFSDQPSVVCEVLLVDKTLHCDLQGYMGESAACAYASALSRASVARSVLHGNATGGANEAGAIFSYDDLEAFRDVVNGWRVAVFALPKTGQASLSALWASQ